jgi:hypothetical protein
MIGVVGAAVCECDYACLRGGALGLSAARPGSAEMFFVRRGVGQVEHRFVDPREMVPTPPRAKSANGADRCGNPLEEHLEGL